jgi:uncharacterized protein
VEKIFKIEPAIVDTGIIYALADKKDKWHEPAVDFLKTFHSKLIVTSSVIPEACYLLNTYLGLSAEAAFVKSLADRELLIEHFNNIDMTRCMELLHEYKDANIGFVDASIMAIAERLKVKKIFTTDRRHFSILKPKHCKSFTLAP